MKSVLVLSTCYDRVSYYTSRWAADLRESLVKRKDTICLLHDAVAICRSGSAFSEAVERVDYVVFYGHGTTNQWIALPERANTQPAISTVALVDLGSVAVLQGKKVYSSCCWSLKGLGLAHFRGSGEGFVGYDQEFDFEFSNEAYFKEVVNQSVIAYVNGDSAQTVARDLRNEWEALRDRFSSGYLSRQPNAPMASTAAGRNAQRVGCFP